MRSLVFIERLFRVAVRRIDLFAEGKAACLQQLIDLGLHNRRGFVIGGEHQRHLNVMHSGIAVDDIFYLTAFAARAFNPNTVHRTFEGIVFHQHVIHAACALAADGDPAPLLQGVVGDIDVIHHALREARVGFFRLDGNMVVVTVDIVVGNTDILAIDRIDGVGIRRMPRRKNTRAVDIDIVRVAGDHVEAG